MPLKDFALVFLLADIMFGVVQSFLTSEKRQ